MRCSSRRKRDSADFSRSAARALEAFRSAGICERRALKSGREEKNSDGGMRREHFLVGLVCLSLRVKHKMDQKKQQASPLPLAC
jgi:hypothetical protein